MRLGHISHKRIQRLVKDVPLSLLDLEELSRVNLAYKGKITKRPFTSKGERAKQVLKLVHSDVCGPLSKPACGGGAEITHVYQ